MLIQARGHMRKDLEFLRPCEHGPSTMAYLPVSVTATQLHFFA